MSGNKERRLDVMVRLSPDLQYYTLEDVEKAIAEAKQRAVTEGIRNITFEVDQNRGYYDDVSIDVYIKGWRAETDEEMNLRIQQEERDSKRSKEVEYASYLRLKKKFENGGH